MTRTPGLSQGNDQGNVTSSLGRTESLVAPATATILRHSLGHHPLLLDFVPKEGQTGTGGWEGTCLFLDADPHTTRGRHLSSRLPEGTGATRRAEGLAQGRHQEGPPASEQGQALTARAREASLR